MAVSLSKGYFNAPNYAPFLWVYMVFFDIKKNKKARKYLIYRLFANSSTNSSGLDGTRTRDPLRDRQVF